MLDLGKQIGRIIAPGDKISLRGTLGAGKTTLARGILQGLGFTEEVPSPTFAIVQQYDPPEVRIPVAHIDFYRIEDTNEIQALALDDILSYSALVAEWPERLPESFWMDALQIDINILSEATRQLTWRAAPAWKERWPIHS